MNIRATFSFIVTSGYSAGKLVPERIIYSVEGGYRRFDGVFEFIRIISS